MQNTSLFCFPMVEDVTKKRGGEGGKITKNNTWKGASFCQIGEERQYPTDKTLYNKNCNINVFPNKMCAPDLTLPRFGLSPPFFYKQSELIDQNKGWGSHWATEPLR